MYEHRCLENIKRLYKTAGKCDDQQQYKDILEETMVSTTEVCTDNSHISPNQYEPTKNPSARKSLRPFLGSLDVKYNTAARGLGAAKSKCKAFRAGNASW